MSKTKNILNFITGMILGVIGVTMWQYDKFLYYSVFCVQAVILYILINYFLTSHNKDYDFGSEKEPQPKGKDASHPYHNQ